MAQQSKQPSPPDRFWFVYLILFSPIMVLAGILWVIRKSVSTILYPFRLLWYWSEPKKETRHFVSFGQAPPVLEHDSPFLEDEQPTPPRLPFAVANTVTPPPKLSGWKRYFWLKLDQWSVECFSIYYVSVLILGAFVMAVGHIAGAPFLLVYRVYKRLNRMANHQR